MGPLRRKSTHYHRPKGAVPRHPNVSIGALHGFVMRALMTFPDLLVCVSLGVEQLAWAAPGTGWRGWWMVCGVTDLERFAVSRAALVHLVRLSETALRCFVGVVTVLLPTAH